MLYTKPQMILQEMTDRRWHDWYHQEIGRYSHKSEAFYSYALDLSGYVDFKREYIIAGYRLISIPPVDIAFKKDRVAIEIDTANNKGARSGRSANVPKKRKEGLIAAAGWSLIRVKYRLANIDGMEYDLEGLYEFLSQNGIHPGR